MKGIEKVFFWILTFLLTAVLGTLAVIVYDVSTTTCLESDTVKRIVSVDGNANRAVVELTNGGTTTVVLGHITEGKTVCKTYGKKQ